MLFSAVYKKGVIIWGLWGALFLAENDKIEIGIRRVEGNLERVMKFANMWKNMPEDKLKVFSEILEGRERLGCGWVALG